jgi:hypothetical protein
MIISPITLEILHPWARLHGFAYGEPSLAGHGSWIQNLGHQNLKHDLQSYKCKSMAKENTPCGYTELVHMTSHD